jgi:hypothetical protein
MLQGAANVSPFIFWTYGKVEITFSYMVSSSWGPFAEDEPRRELQQRLNALVSDAVLDEALGRRPGVALGALAARTDEFLAVLDWTFKRARASLAR